MRDLTAGQAQVDAPGKTVREVIAASVTGGGWITWAIWKQTST